MVQAMGYQSGRERSGSLMSVYMGIDWSMKKHDFAILNEVGAVIAQAVILHQKSGFRQLDETGESLEEPAVARTLSRTSC